jgi:hypothetical protein
MADSDVIHRCFNYPHPDGICQRCIVGAEAGAPQLQPCVVQCILATCQQLPAGVLSRSGQLRGITAQLVVWPVPAGSAFQLDGLLQGGALLDLLKLLAQICCT